MPWIHLQEVLSYNLVWESSYPDMFHGFPESPQVNVRIPPQLGHDPSLPNPFKFNYHITI